jgi:cytochrome c oxidase subunit 2
MRCIRRLLAAFSMLMTASASVALAQAPEPWELGLQHAAGPLQQRIIDLHTLVLVIITLVTLLVAVLLLVAVARFHTKRHPVPNATSHNTVLEIAWTVLPVLILMIIVIPSFRLIYYEDRTHDPDLTVKVTGHQWYWEYTYPDNNKIDFNSTLIPDDQLKPGQLRLLEVDNQLVVPVGKNIRVLTTSGDVIHSFFIPSVGIQRYAIPGRVIETWMRIDQPGVYYGQCNQICGTNHSRMPISVRALPEQEFQAWLTEAKTKFSDATPASEQPRLIAAAAGAER